MVVYDRCSDGIHSWNPHRSGPRVINFERPVSEWLDRLELLLATHLIRLVGEAGFLLIVFRRPDDGSTQLVRAVPISESCS